MRNWLKWIEESERIQGLESTVFFQFQNFFAIVKQNFRFGIKQNYSTKTRSYLEHVTTRQDSLSHNGVRRSPIKNVQEARAVDDHMRVGIISFFYKRGRKEGTSRERERERQDLDTS